jgi:hypothetical protein
MESPIHCPTWAKICWGPTPVNTWIVKITATTKNAVLKLALMTLSNHHNSSKETINAPITRGKFIDFLIPSQVQKVYIKSQKYDHTFVI